MKTLNTRRQESHRKLATRLPLLIPGFIALAAGIAAGLSRLGWDGLSSSPLDLAHLHAPLMIAGFFGTVIGLERAVALGRWPAFFSPLLSGLGSLLLIAGIYPATGAAMILGGSLAFLAATAWVTLIQPVFHMAILLVGAAFLMAANLAWFFGASIETVLPAWMAFLVLTIVGERLELSRLHPVDLVAKAIFAGIITVYIVSVILASFGFPAASAVMGLCLTAMAIWLIFFDIARNTVRQKGLPRFIAVCLLTGYGWLALGGGLWMVWSGLPGLITGPAYLYDAALHAVFLGFVLAMVFGHAPIILPAVTTLAVPFHAAFYLHVALLEASLALRIAADFLADDGLRLAAGFGNALTVVLFVFNTVLAVRRGIAAKANQPRRTHSPGLAEVSKS